ncbi:hypothetical protein KKC87_04530 [Patescibacteria group bacterium]|nr:hypothetical protein [Patescibacteria group bacterium]
MKAKFESKGNKLFIDGKKVLKGWESFNGWYWFATEKEDEGETEFGNDTIWFGFVQGHEEEWGSFSQGEIESLGKMKVWEIPQKALPYSGRRGD